MKPSYRLAFIERRSQLMAELFLQTLDPHSLARPTDNFEYDFLITFRNKRGGLNTFGVEVKGTELEVGDSFSLDKRSHDRMTMSNIPVLFVIADVKQNTIFFGWPKRANQRVQLRKADGVTTGELREQLVHWPTSTND
jgi:hypothetical protein